jgi:TATA-box binding protein (TBP) (component of TFIID and TFIIIB)
LLGGLAAIVLGLALNLSAEETNLEKAETQKNKTMDSLKKKYRKAKDEICQMTNGKMVCVKRKLVDGVQNATDKIKTDAIEVKNKADYGKTSV